MPQLLRAHEISEYIFNVADVTYPVSIRDQMNRAAWLVRKAHDQGFFGPRRAREFRKLLVCGAGAAGVTAALEALSLGVETVLVERGPAPFARQRRCTSRWIDPVQYDWSAPHWTLARYPHAGPPMPLPWSADRSHRLALAWLMSFLRAAKNPLLSFRSNDRIIDVPQQIRSVGPASSVLGLRVTFQTGLTDVFGMMLWSVGFGEERRTAPPSHTGFAFWDSDPFEHPNWGVRGTDPRAVVSGGGDGALQDFIRLSTGRKSALDAMEEIRKAGWSIPDRQRHFLYVEEDQAQRALLWCRPSSLDEHRVLERLHASYVSTIDELSTTHPDSARLIVAVRRLITQRSVSLVHPCSHLARCYGLNRFVALLLERIARIDGLNVARMPQRGLSRTHSASCANQPWACHGVTHDVELEARPSCTMKGPVASTERLQAEVVVVRHGIIPNADFENMPMALARQIMPYHLP